MLESETVEKFDACNAWKHTEAYGFEEHGGAEAKKQLTHAHLAPVCLTAS